MFDFSTKFLYALADGVGLVGLFAAPYFTSRVKGGRRSFRFSESADEVRRVVHLVVV